ncbi:MAG: hypothetical protein JRJ03_14765, partial [Deltaproteobacteria bacterium]|nr:hypothetical protein [Deltaproteobacteria bacterium]
MKKLLIFVVAAAFVFASVLPAMAQDNSVSFYGQVYFKTWIIDKDKEVSATDYDDTDLEWDLHAGNTRFGANFKTGDISGTVEIRPDSGAGASNIIRVWQGTWDFGSGKLTIGQTYVPTFMPADTSVDYGDVGNLLGTVR